MDQIKPVIKRNLARGKMRPLDPVQVLYLERLDLAFLVVSKNACSSIKESFVSTVLGDVDLPFEQVHNYLYRHKTVLEGKGLLVRLFFSARSMSRFLQQKNLLLVQRPVLSRVLSAYSDYTTDKNRMIFPMRPAYRLDRWRQADWEFQRFAEVIAGIDDYLSDRHYRSQSFLWDAIPPSCKIIKLDLRELETQFARHPLLSQVTAPRKRNRTANAQKPELLPATRQILQDRYATDLIAGVPFE